VSVQAAVIPLRFSATVRQTLLAAFP